MQRMFFIIAVVTPLLVLAVAELQGRRGSRLSSPEGPTERSRLHQGLSQTKDLGLVMVGSQHEIEYSFANLTDEPWRVVRFETSCGCTRARISSPTVLAGSTAKVVLGFQAPSDPANTKQAATLIFKGLDNKERRVRFLFSANVRAPIEIKGARSLVNIHAIDETLSKSLTVQGAEANALDNLVVSSDLSWLKCKVLAPETAQLMQQKGSGVAAEKKLILTGEVPERNAGRIHGKLVLKGGGHQVVVPLVIDLQPAVRVLPSLSVIDFGRQDATLHRILPSKGVNATVSNLRLQFNADLVRAEVFRDGDDLFLRIAPGKEISRSARADVRLFIPDVSSYPVSIGVLVK